MKKLMIPDLRYFIFLAYNVVNLKMKWLEQTFLKYLDDWETYVKTKDAIPKAANQFCLLPSQTSSGLKLTGKYSIFILSIWNIYLCASVYSFYEIAKFLLSQPNVGYLLSESFNQDTCESYFGQQRSRDQRNNNPSEQQFLYNAQLIIVQKSLVSGTSSSITKKKHNLELSPLCRPLPKRRCVRRIT